MLEWYSSRPDLPEAATHATCTDATYASWHHKPATWDWGAAGRTGFHRWAVRKETTERRLTLSYLYDDRVYATDTCEDQLPAADLRGRASTAAGPRSCRPPSSPTTSGPFTRPAADQLPDPGAGRARHVGRRAVVRSAPWWLRATIPALARPRGCLGRLPVRPHGSSATTAAPVAPITRRSGPPGHGERKAERRGQAHADGLRPGSALDGGLQPGVTGVRPARWRYAVDGRPRLGLGDRQPLVAEAAGVDVVAGCAEVGAGEGGAVGEGVEALALEVRRGRVGHHRDAHRQHAAQADDQHRDLAGLVATAASRAGSWYWPMGTGCSPSIANVASSPRTSGRNGSETCESIRTTTTAPPVWQ